MRDVHFQTPQKDLSTGNRRLKSAVDHQKKLKKVEAGKKSLITDFSAVVEDDSPLNSPKDSVDFSTVSDLFEDTQLTESVENLIGSVSPASSPTSESVAFSGLTSLSRTTSDEHKSYTAWETPLSAQMKPKCIEAELVIDHLKLAQRQVLNSGDMDLQSKRLLDALLNTIIEDLMGVPEEKEHLNEQNFSRAFVLVCLSFFLWILAAFAVVLYYSNSKQAFRGATPT